MKVLILALASEEQPWKRIREEGALRTWDSVQVEGVDTIYYFPGVHHFDGNKLFVYVPAGFYNMHERLKHTLQVLKIMHEHPYKAYPSNDEISQQMEKNLELFSRDWDFIFRISASSYVNKEELLKKALTLPKEKCYCGIKCCGGEVASGSGFFMSRDVAEILANELPDGRADHPDDVMIGRLLESKGIMVTPGAERYDYYHAERPIPITYHYRCKDDNAPNDGTQDIKAMHEIHKFLGHE